MRLKHWSCWWKEVEFDPNSGSASSVLRLRKPDDSEIPNGVAAFERSTYGILHSFAVIQNEGTFYFYSNGMCWALGQPGLQFVHENHGRFVSHFRILKNGIEEYSIKYLHLFRALFARADVTYDLLDEEADYFLVAITEMANSKEWTKGNTQQWVNHHGLTRRCS